jgi:hypothetical protein
MAIHHKRSKHHKLSKSKKYNSKKTKKTNKTNKTNKHSRKSKQHHKKSHNKHHQKGGFAGDCNLASIKEPGFNVPTLGDITGLSIPESRAAIFRPDCKVDTYQAMTP